MPNLRATLKNADNTPINLTTATSVNLAVKAVDGAPVWKKPCVIVNAAQGIVEYDFVAADTLVPDTYNAEFEIAFGTEIQTVPNDSYFTFTVIADLG